MNKIDIIKTFNHLKHRYGTMNNIVVAFALIIAASWAWGSITMMQRNFALQKDFDARKRELELTELEVATLEYQQNYYRSDEYKDLAAREHLGLAAQGEKVLILPPNTEAAKQYGKEPLIEKQSIEPGSAPSNLEQWADFLLGTSAEHLQK